MSFMKQSQKLTVDACKKDTLLNVTGAHTLQQLLPWKKTSIKKIIMLIINSTPFSNSIKNTSNANKKTFLIFSRTQI